MPQMHFYVPEKVAEQLRAKAQAQGMPVSRYLASVVTKDVGQGWPEGYFEKVVGQWQGKPLRRPPQGTLETREDL